MLEEALDKHRHGEYDEAERLYRRMLEDEPDNYELINLLAVLKQETGELDDALELAEKAIELRPNAAAYYATLGSILSSRGDLAGARANLETALEMNPNLPQGHNTLGYLQFRLGELEEAEKTLRTSLRLDPESHQAMTNLGNVLLADGRVDEAVSYFQDALERKPDLLAAKGSLGEALMRQGAVAIAEECFRACLKARPDSLRFKTQLAGALLAGDRLDEAKELLEAVVAEEPDDPAAVAALGRIAAARGNHAPAVERYQRALLRRRGHPETIEWLAESLAELGQFDAAVRCYESLDAAVRPRLAVKLARARAGAGQRDAAEQELRALLANESVAGEAAVALAELLADHDPAAARRALREVPEAASGRDAAALALAELELEQGLPDAALEALKRIPRGTLEGADNARARTLLGRALDANGAFKQAAEAFQDVGRVLALPPLEAAVSRYDLAAALSWPREPIDDGRGEPVFLTGAPGSGVAVLAAALNRLPSVEVLTDRETEPGERRDLLDSDPRARRGKREPEAHLRLERRAYWRALERRRTKTRGRVLAIDLLTPQQCDVFTIARFFPRATFLALKRHPADLLLHARSLGWRLGRLVRPQDILSCYRPLLDAGELAVDVVWIDFSDLIAGRNAPLQALLERFELEIGGLGEALAAETERAAGRYWPAGHWLNYRENLALLSPELSRLAANLGYQS